MLNDMHSEIACEAEGVNFIDMNADGLDDLVCIDSKGNAYLSINQGDGDAQSKKPPSFKNLGLIKTTETTKRKYVFLADIDGDGRGDYGVQKEANYLWTDSFWRNGGVEDKPKYWQALGSRSIKYDDTFWHRYADINGDVSTAHATHTIISSTDSLDDQRAVMTICKWATTVTLACLQIA